MTHAGRLSFGPFVLDRRDARLFRDGEPLPLTPKALEVLNFLGDNAVRLAPKEQIVDAVRREGIVRDGPLQVCVREGGQALGDDAKVPKFVETVHRRGYRSLERPRPADDEAGPKPAVSIGPPVPQPPPTLVGRKAELGQLLAGLEAAR